MKIANWKSCIRNRTKWKNFVEKAKTFTEVVAPQEEGRPKNRWEDDVKSDITRMQIANWKSCIRNRTRWKKFVEKARTFLKL